MQPPSETASAVRFYRRALASEVPRFAPLGWQVTATDWSPSVGDLVLLEWTGPMPPPAEENHVGP